MCYSGAISTIASRVDSFTGGVTIVENLLCLVDGFYVWLVAEGVAVISSLFFASLFNVWRRRQG